MIRLGIHLDPIAALRQAGDGREPDLLAAGHAAMLGGADLVIARLGVTAGPGAAEADLRRLREALGIPLHVEIENAPEALALMRALRPEHVCLVPPRTPLGRAAGLDLGDEDDVAALARTLGDLRGDGISAGLLLEPDESALVAASGVEAEVVELVARRYGTADTDARRVVALRELERAAASARALGMRVHVGHGLDTANVSRVAAFEDVEAVHAGHAVAARAVFLGLQVAVAEFRVRATRARKDEAVTP